VITIGAGQARGSATIRRRTACVVGFFPLGMTTNTFHGQCRRRPGRQDPRHRFDQRGPDDPGDAMVVVEFRRDWPADQPRQSVYVYPGPYATALSTCTRSVSRTASSTRRRRCRPSSGEGYGTGDHRRSAPTRVPPSSRPSWPRASMNRYAQARQPSIAITRPADGPRATRQRRRRRTMSRAAAHRPGTDPQPTQQQRCAESGDHQRVGYDWP
jgi:hypothetical protein